METNPKPITTGPGHVGPVAPQERIEILDILRGWAIFGVLLVDIERLYRSRSTWTASDQSVYQFIELFASDKFWTLLAFLFGLGFSLQLIRAERRGSGFSAVYRRRLLALMLIGVAQFILLTWGGAFLIRYGGLGFVLLALRRLPSRTLLPAAIIFMLIPWAYLGGLGFIHARRLANPETRAEVLRADAEGSAPRIAIQREVREARDAGYNRRVAVQAKFFWQLYVFNLYQSLSGWFINPPLAYVSWCSQLGLFFVGLYAGRRRVLEDIPAHLPLIRRVLTWGLVLGLAVSAVRYLMPDFSILGVLGDPALAFAYGSSIVLLAQRRSCQRLFVPLAAAGRMALTNYLLMALLLGVLAPAFGFGVYDRIGPTLGPALAAATYAGLMWLSTWWLKHFRFGPAEWLWRTLAYGKLQPMRLQPSLAPAGLG